VTSRYCHLSVDESRIAGSGHDSVGEAGTINPGGMAESRTDDDEILTVGEGF
jgi:hypothetical protein